MMMHKVKELKAQYVTNEKGKKTAVILPIESFEELLEDLALAAERRDEPTLSHKEVLARLKKNGLL